MTNMEKTVQSLRSPSATSLQTPRDMILVGHRVRLHRSYALSFAKSGATLDPNNSMLDIMESQVC